LFKKIKEGREYESLDLQLKNLTKGRAGTIDIKAGHSGPAFISMK
jgi:hypothetical protein